MDLVEDPSGLASTFVGAEVFDAHVTCCHTLLSNMATSESLAAEAVAGNGKPLFSIYQTQQLSKCLEFVVCLGVYPFLSPGVSAPLELRMEHWEKFALPQRQNAPDKRQKLLQIASCFSTLWQSPTRELRGLLAPNLFLGDYIAVLLQLGYEPISSTAPPKDAQRQQKEEEEKEETIHQTLEARRQLRSLLSDLPRPVALRELFFFQAGFCQSRKTAGSAGRRAPRWLQTACGRLISQLLIAKPRASTEDDAETDSTPSPARTATSGRGTAVHDLILAVLDVIGGAQSADPRRIPAVAGALARILATPPSPPLTTSAQPPTHEKLSSVVSKDQPWRDRYYRSLAPQIVDLLKTRSTATAEIGDSQASRRAIERIGHLLAINTIHEICQRNLNLGAELFLEAPLLRPLRRMLAPNSTDGRSHHQPEGPIDASDSCELLSGRELRRLVRFCADIVDLLKTRSTATAEIGDSQASRRAIERIGHLLAINTIHEICQRNLNLGAELFLEAPLLRPLRRMLAPNSTDGRSHHQPEGPIDASDSCELLSGRELRRLVRFCADLLDTVHPSQAMLTLLMRHSQPLFHLFASHLTLTEADEQQPAQDGNSLLCGLESVLLALLKASEASAVDLLRGWLGLDSLDSTTFEPASPPPSRPFPVRPGVVLRPSHLVSQSCEEAEGEEEEEEVVRLVRVCLLAESSSLNPLLNISAYVAAAMRLLHDFCPEAGVETTEGVQIDQASPVSEEQLKDSLFSQMESDVSTTVAATTLPSLLFISLISDVNRRISDLVAGPTLDTADGNIILPTPSTASLEANSSSPTSLTASLLASSMLEQLSPDTLWPKNPQLAVRLFSLTLNRLCLTLRTCSDCDVVAVMQEESLALVLGMLAFYVNHMEVGDKVPSAVRDCFAQLVPLLQQVEQVVSTRASASRDLARQLRISLCTRGAVPAGETSLVPPGVDVEAEPSGRASLLFPTLDTPNQNRSSKPLIEEIFPANLTGDATAETSPTKMDEKLASAFELLRDSLLPVRGHGLIEMSRLLESRDPAVRGFEDKIYEVLVKQLDEEDSYLYLNAVRGLSALGNAFTDRLLPVLLHHFHSPKPTASRIEFRLKMGEAIVRVLRDLGQMAVNYRDLVMSGLLKASSDPDEYIRAASLSNMAEIARLLRHGIQPVVYEICGVIEDHLKHDSSPCVRRSAAFLAARGLFQGAPGDPLPSFLPADVLRDVHRLLSDQSRIERDPSVLEQIEAALGQLHARTQSSVFLKPDSADSLVKEIHVIRPFEN
ncbi:Transport and Golgi organization protein 6 [Sparganum proliferum]